MKDPKQQIEELELSLKHLREDLQESKAENLRLRLQLDFLREQIFHIQATPGMERGDCRLRIELNTALFFCRSNEERRKLIGYALERMARDLQRQLLPINLL